MSLKPRYADLLDEFRTRHQGLWESLALLTPAEWDYPPLAGAASARRLFHACMLADAELEAYCRAAAVGLSLPQEVWPRPPLVDPPEELMDYAIELAQRIDDQLADFDNHQWQRKLTRDRELLSAAALVDRVNATFSQAQHAVDVFLGSFERLGKEGLKAWLLAVYNEIMDSVAGLTEQALLSWRWYDSWTTYQIVEHVWAWNQQLLAVARRWQEPDLQVEFRALPERGEFNPYLNAIYESDDMIAAADGLVTVYRKTVAFIDAADPDLFSHTNNLPWGGRGDLSQLLFEGYRHAWRHAQEIRRARAEDPESFQQA